MGALPPAHTARPPKSIWKDEGCAVVSAPDLGLLGAVDLCDAFDEICGEFAAGFAVLFQRDCDAVEAGAAGAGPDFRAQCEAGVAVSDGAGGDHVDFVAQHFLHPVDFTRADDDARIACGIVGGQPTEFEIGCAQGFEPCEVGGVIDVAEHIDFAKAHLVGCGQRPRLGDAGAALLVCGERFAEGQGAEGTHRIFIAGYRSPGRRE
jgi:hypothetical protein